MLMWGNKSDGLNRTWGGGVESGWDLTLNLFFALIAQESKDTICSMDTVLMMLILENKVCKKWLFRSKTDDYIAKQL